MTVRITASGTIALEGTCPSEDAEVLLQEMLANPQWPVDWRACESVHAAVFQVLLAAKPTLLGPPADPRLENWVHPLLTRIP